MPVCSRKVVMKTSLHRHHRHQYQHKKPSTNITIAIASVKPIEAKKSTVLLSHPLKDSNSASIVPKTRANHSSLEKVDDIDARGQGKVEWVAEYAPEIYEHFKRTEIRIVPYLHQHGIITADARGSLVDYIFQLQLQHRVSIESLYLAIMILDKVFAKCDIHESELQLLGTACLYLASKYEDIYPPEIVEMAAACDLNITSGDILDCETKILRALEYRLSENPTSLTFLIRFARAGHADKRIMQTAHFFLEGTLISYNLLCKYKPSQLAAASVYLARHYAVGRSNWSVTLEKYSEYTESEIIPVAQAVLSVQATRRRSGQFPTIDKKYTERFGGVAKQAFAFDI